MADCIRRPGAVWTTCPCPPCTEDRKRLHKRARAGVYRRVTYQEAWEVLDELLARGWSGLAIASASNLHPKSLQTALTRYTQTGERAQFGPTISAKIVRHGLPRTGLIGIHGSQRRLRALARIGWSLKAMSAECGLQPTTLWSIQSGHRGENHAGRSCKAEHAAVIREMYDRISMTPGGSRQSQNAAEKRGWAPPLAWDDDTIDDPSATPQGMDEGKRQWVDLDEVIFLLDNGVTPQDVARRLGVDRDSITQRARKNKRRDVLIRMALDKERVSA